MNSGKMIVLRGDCGLEKKVSKKTIVLLVDSLDEVMPSFVKWGGENRVFCIVVREPKPLADIELSDDFKEVPIALYAAESGTAKTILAKAGPLKEYNISLLLSAHKPENFTYLQILSSLGISCGVYLENDTLPVDWDMMNDLMYYAAYTRVDHAPIEPFSYVISHYDPQETTCFTAPWFEDPKQFLHMDSSENLSMSQMELKDGEYIASGISAIDSIEDNEKYNEKLSIWMNQFIDNKRCASCPAWRVCGGAYLSVCERDPKYFQFFNDLMEAAEQKLEKQKRTSTWRL